MPIITSFTYDLPDGPRLELTAWYWPPTPATLTSPPDRPDMEILGVLCEGYRLPVSVIEYITEPHWDSILSAADQASRYSNEP